MEPRNLRGLPGEDEIQKWQKLPFRIVHVSSEDEGYSVNDLINRTPFSKGWLSSHFCNYPQEIMIEFPRPVKIREIQFLSHQFCIATKIEIYILPPKSEKFKKIGYLSLDNNERSNFQARELKTVYTNYFCIRVKFSLIRCYSNSLNIYSQVGLIAISILGEIPNNNNTNDQNIHLENMDKLENEMMYDPITLKRLKELYRAKKKAVEFEDFDEAKRIKIAIDSLKSVSQSLIQLEERKKMAIKNDDFDAAKLIKFEIDRLRNAVAGVNDTNRTVHREEYSNDQNNQLPQNYQPINKGFENTEFNNLKKNMYEGYPNINKINENKNTNIINQEIKQSTNRTKDTPDPFNRDTKGVVDIDNLKVGGMGLNFSEMVEAQLQKEGMGEGGTASSGDGDLMLDLDGEAYKFGEPLIPVLTSDLVKLLFSREWKTKEHGFELLNKEIQDYPNGPSFGTKSPEEIVVACLGACSYVLRSNMSQALLAAMDAIIHLFNKFSNIKPEGMLRGDFDKYVHDCIRLLIDHIGDPNLKLKEKLENTLLEFANYSIIGNKVLFDQIIQGAIKKTLINSKNHLAGRYNFLNRLIQNFGYDENEVPLESIMNYAIKGYTNPQVAVRDAALNLIVILYKFAGNKIRPFYATLRPAQINNIEDNIQRSEESNANNNINNQNYNINDVEPGDFIYEENNNNINNENDEMVNNSQMLSKEQENELNMNNEDSEHTCQFCGLFDPSLNSDQIDLHQYRECPMLIPCFKCKQIVEISGLNQHFLNECAQKKQFKQCPRCREAVLIKDYQAHVTDKSCNPFKASNICNRCPLCHNDITPAGKVGWEIHLLEQTCPNNPRTNS